MTEPTNLERVKSACPFGRGYEVEAAKWMSDILEEIIDSWEHCFIQGVHHDPDGRMDHMCLSAYEHAKDLSIRIGFYKEGDFSRK